MRHSPVTLLMVDSDRHLRTRLAAYLEDWGAELNTCGSVAEALQFLGSTPVDLVVCEAQLEDGSGFDIHAEAASRDIPSVFFSEETQVRNVIEALRVGVADFILKPLDDFSVVTRVIEKVLKVSQLEAKQGKDRESLERLSRELMQHLQALEQDQVAGRLVQKKLMPDSKAHLADIEVSYEILPSMHLSGDTVDFGLFGRRYLAFYLLDVSGHGSASAFIAVWVKQIVRGFFKGLNSGRSGPYMDQHIPTLLQHINEQLIEADVGKHLTCFVGVIDTHTSSFNYVVAGHLPLPILASPDGAIVLEGKGKPLGIFPSAQWSLMQLKLPEQFSLTVCSDGVFDLLPEAHLNEKEACLLQQVELHKPQSADALKSILAPEKLDVLPDDVALLVLSKLAKI